MKLSFILIVQTANSTKVFSKCNEAFNALITYLEWIERKKNNNNKVFKKCLIICLSIDTNIKYMIFLQPFFRSKTIFYPIQLFFCRLGLGLELSEKCNESYLFYSFGVHFWLLIHGHKCQRPYNMPYSGHILLTGWKVKQAWHWTSSTMCLFISWVCSSSWQNRHQ